MIKTQHDRKAFIDRLEKKYIKKVQLHAFKRESELLKHQLNAMRGVRLNNLGGQSFDILDGPEFRRMYS